MTLHFIATTRADFIKSEWRENILPQVELWYERDGRKDIPARREAWNNGIDYLVQARSLPKRAMDWSCPD